MPLNASLKEDIIQQQILEAAKRLFHVHGLHKVTMDDVAKAIGKGRSSLYYYYKSKDEIFDAVIQIDIKDMLAAIRTAVEKAETVEQKIHAFCASKLTILRGRRSFYNTLDVGMDADAISNLNKMKVIHHNLVMKLEGNLLDEILTGGIKGGELNPLDNTEKEMLVFVLLSSLHGLKQEMRILNDFENIEPMAATLSHLVMHGLKK